VKSCFEEVLTAHRSGKSHRASIAGNPHRQATQTVNHVMRVQWSSVSEGRDAEDISTSAGEAVDGLTV
jgi:hypothetical protein